MPVDLSDLWYDTTTPASRLAPADWNGVSGLCRPVSPVYSSLQAAVVPPRHGPAVREQAALPPAVPQVVEERPLVHRPSPTEARLAHLRRPPPLGERVLGPLPPPRAPDLDGLGVEPVERRVPRARHEVAVLEGEVVGEAAAALHGLGHVQAEAGGRAAHAEADCLLAVGAASTRRGAAVHARPHLPAVRPRPGTHRRDPALVAQGEEEAAVVRTEHLGRLGPGRRREESQPEGLPAPPPGPADPAADGRPSMSSTVGPS
ncbi:hypothetical protein THAOC_36568 [Thalassiosira oceanica]|uniref:Uncharacterized protein n=1 Tax=Thalassiosira oceanica TaxID=159749 RepID=K0REA6_THAOC|nr:hypothetical protein THAOC_36568 [Thalassiosira oceanica]|eukprot:EJK44862.1 hypothetical protein THAOC_36568 [Thalassiosira oceanica]